MRKTDPPFSRYSAFFIWFRNKANTKNDGKTGKNHNLGANVVRVSSFISPEFGGIRIRQAVITLTPTFMWGLEQNRQNRIFMTIW